MTARRISAAAFVGVVPLLLTPLAAGPAQAHGAPTDPVSRVAACGPEGSQRGSAACRAAVAANGGGAFEKWDNLRLADVRGRDRQVVPDGQLCSAGLAAYRGLDVGRADWPATKLKAGSAFTLTYRSTIPHRGTFSLYLTKQGHDPAAPLRWSDLAEQPFATAKDPVLKGGAYKISGQLPRGLTGRHVLYTVWRNSDTPDTYYSCSDVVLTGAAKPAPAQPAPRQPTPEQPADEQAAAPRQPAEPKKPDAEQSAAPPADAAKPADPARQEQPDPAPASAASDADGPTTAVLGTAAAALALVALGASVLRWRRGTRTR
ncbi:lytic polysaccharide monooxygenase [Streptomyces sp. NPDC051907]|uniref:lytic polysaccharide monooxygenase auxiliary activity family 9 protein n=1 Tax=Streptomyces sp. NPDC051907 TaxID=3155284 RepID=UPI0034435BEC